MIVLAFLGALAAIFFAVIAIESDSENRLKLQRPIGLITWLTRGNWPAKIGSVLLVVGVGALLRYALVTIEIAPQLKLVAGIAIAFILGFISTRVPDGGARRPVSLALGGAAFGVAYLTAYSAFCIFGYFSNPVGLALLGLTSVAASVFAVTRSALSLAILSMVGAFLAPAFAVTDAGPLIVYGYYLAASLLTLVMVTMRGWRPLIHLSFLFTLVGGVFFAWTASYYTELHAAVMLPMLLLLATVHVVMPILEKGRPHTLWLARLDLAYLLALPTVAALLAVIISPSRPDLSMELFFLGGVWGLAAIGLQQAAREGVAAHAGIAFLFLILGVAARFSNLPWILISLALCVGALAIAAMRCKPVGRLHDLLAGLVLLAGAIHVLYATSAPADGPAFLNAAFVERLIGAILLIMAGVVCRRIRQLLDTLLLAVGILWAVLAISIELVRWELATFAFMLHWMLLLLAVSMWIPGRRIRIADKNVGLLIIAIVAIAPWASMGELPVIAVWVSMFVAPLVLVSVAVRPLMAEGESHDQRLGAALMAPAVATIWALKAGSVTGIGQWQFGFAVAAVIAIVVLVTSSVTGSERGSWRGNAADVFGVGFASLLTVITLVYVMRNPWAIILELLCLAVLVVVAYIRNPQQRLSGLPAIASVVGLALIIQANILRWLGPAGNLDITDVLHLKWSAVVSLLWALLGSALTILSQKTASRVLWVAGAALLVASAIKLLLIDFGSLGQLANIFAVIAAGVVFLLVGWLAPMPPAETTQTLSPSGQTAPKAIYLRAKKTSGHQKNVWTLAVVLMAVTLLHFFGVAQYVKRAVLSHSVPVRSEVILDHSGRAVGQEAPAVTATVRRGKIEGDRIDNGARTAVNYTQAPQGAATEKLLISHVGADLTLPSQPLACQFLDLVLPQDFVIYAAGAYGGVPLGIALPGSENMAGKIDVYVKSTRPVVVMLSAYSSVIWNVHWTRSTRIVAILASGYEDQMIVGNQKDTPTLISTYENRNSCGYHYMTREGDISKANSLAQKLFSRSIDTAYAIEKGRVEMGDKLILGEEMISSDWRSLSSVINAAVPAGEAGLQELIRGGFIRPATGRDHADVIRYFMEKRMAGKPASPTKLVGFAKPASQLNNLKQLGGVYGSMPYVVLHKFTIPPGNEAGSAGIFIVPEGAPLPDGEPGGGSIVDLNSGKCLARRRTSCAMFNAGE